MTCCFLSAGERHQTKIEKDHIIVELVRKLYHYRAVFKFIDIIDHFFLCSVIGRNYTAALETKIRSELTVLIMQEVITLIVIPILGRAKNRHSRPSRKQFLWTGGF